MKIHHTSRFCRFGSAVRRVALGAAAISVGLGGLVGCASEQALSDIREENRALNERVQRLNSENVQYQSAASVQQNELLRQEQTISELNQANQHLTRQITDMGGQLNALDERLMNVKVSSLNPGTDQALRQLALNYPSLLSYDADSGMIRFASDFTFDSGSDVVKPEALEALRTLSRVLMTDASIYDIQVVGHTDSQQISEKSRKNHATNRHLSCHRAISVSNALASAGVQSTRIRAGGWGEYRPLVPNADNGNTPQNRRVEIFLTPSTASIYSNVPTNRTTITPPTNRPVTQVPEEIVK